MKATGGSASNRACAGRPPPVSDLAGAGFFRELANSRSFPVRRFRAMPSRYSTALARPASSRAAGRALIHAIRACRAAEEPVDHRGAVHARRSPHFR
jgi:hypothetical protein